MGFITRDEGGQPTRGEGALTAGEYDESKSLVNAGEIVNSGYFFRTPKENDQMKGVRQLEPELIKKKKWRAESERSGEAELDDNETMEEENSLSTITSNKVSHLTKEELQLQVRDLVETKLEEDSKESEEAINIILDNLPNMS